MFGGSVAWQLALGSQESTKHFLGTQFSINAKADPLITLEGRLDLLFVATKIPYVGQAIMGLQKVADGAGVVDDIWNWLVKKMGGSKNLEIDIDVDYHLDLVAGGAFKVTFEGLKYHTLDGFGGNEIIPEVDLYFGIEAEASIKYKIGKTKGEAIIGAEAKAKWIVQKKTNEAGEKVWEVEYQGLYAVFYARVDNDDKDDVKNPKKEEEKPEKKFLIHKAATFEIKID